MYRLICLIGSTILLSGCWFPAACPWDYAPRRYTSRWSPSDGQCIPIPADRLIDPFVCIGLEKPSTGALTLPEIVDLALINSNQTRQTWAEAREAAAEWGIAQSPLYPDASLNASYSDLFQPSFFTRHLQGPSDQYITYGPCLSLNYLLFDWGTTCQKSESFRQSLWKANWTHNREIQTVIETVLSDYYSYLANHEQVIASLTNLRDAMTTLASTEKKHQLGIDDLSDVLQAKTQVAKQNTVLLNDQQMEADSLSTLIADLGIPANTPLEILGGMNIPELDEEACSLDSYLLQAYLSRPDLFAANANVQSQTANVKATVRDQYPTLGFTGNWNRVYSNAASKGINEYHLVFNLQYPLFKGFEYSNNIRSAKAKLEQAQASMKELEIDIIQQVVQSHQDLLFSVDKIKVNEDYVSIASQSFDSSLSKYMEGTVDITTVANSLSNLADARYSLISAKKDWLTSLTELAYATGTLWRESCQ